MKYILKVSHLTKIFGREKSGFKAIDDVSFNVAAGEILGLLGPNGAGKTTTIFTLIDLIKPTSGQISIFGLDYKNHREKILQRINYSSTYMEMSPRLTVYENLFVISEFYGVKNAHQRIISLAEKFGLNRFLNTLQRNLSAGEKTRVYLAKAFLNQPRLLLLDEPTASLDPDVAETVRREIARANGEGTSVLLTSHNMAEVEELCHRVVFINHGRIVAEDTPEDLAKKVRLSRVNLMIKDGAKRTMAFAKKSGFKSRQKGRFVVIETDERDIAFLLSGLAESGVEYSEISIDKPTLADYFIKITNGS